MTTKQINEMNRDMNDTNINPINTDMDDTNINEITENNENIAINENAPSTEQPELAEPESEGNIEKLKMIAIVSGAVTLGIAVFLLLGLLVKTLWNRIAVKIFGFKEITYLQGIGLFVLIQILTNGLGGANDSNHGFSFHQHDNVETTKG